METASIHLSDSANKLEVYLKWIFQSVVKLLSFKNNGFFTFPCGYSEENKQTNKQINTKKNLQKKKRVLFWGLQFWIVGVTLELLKKYYFEEKWTK